MRTFGAVVASALWLPLTATVQTASAQPVVLAPLPEKAEALVSPGQKAYLDLPLAERRRWLVDTNLYARPVMAWTMPRVGEDGELRTVAVVNCSIDVQDPVAVRLRGVPADAKVAWVPLHGERAALEIRREGGDVVVTLPSLGAWDCGYLSVEKGV